MSDRSLSNTPVCSVGWDTLGSTKTLYVEGCSQGSQGSQGVTGGCDTPPLLARAHWGRSPLGRLGGKQPRTQKSPSIVKGHSWGVSHNSIIYIPPTNYPKASSFTRQRGTVFEKWLTLGESPYTKRGENPPGGFLA